MKFEYTFEGMKLKVLDETFAGKVLEFYSSNREEFDRYEAAKPDNFYTTEYIAATLKAEYAALLKGEFGRFFLFSDDLPGEILGSVSFFGVTSINRSCRIGHMGTSGKNKILSKYQNVSPAVICQKIKD